MGRNTRAQQMSSLGCREGRAAPAIGGFGPACQGHALALPFHPPEAQSSIVRDWASKPLTLPSIGHRLQHAHHSRVSRFNQSQIKEMRIPQGQEGWPQPRTPRPPTFCRLTTLVVTPGVMFAMSAVRMTMAISVAMNPVTMPMAMVSAVPMAMTHIQVNADAAIVPGVG